MIRLDKGGGLQQLCYHGCSETMSQVTPQERHRWGNDNDNDNDNHNDDENIDLERASRPTPPPTFGSWNDMARAGCAAVAEVLPRLTALQVLHLGYRRGCGKSQKKERGLKRQTDRQTDRQTVIASAGQ